MEHASCGSITGIWEKSGRYGDILGRDALSRRPSGIHFCGFSCASGVFGAIFHTNQPFASKKDEKTVATTSTWHPRTTFPENCPNWLPQHDGRPKLQKCRNFLLGTAKPHKNAGLNASMERKPRKTGDFFWHPPLPPLPKIRLRSGGGLEGGKSIFL